jgi:hypothetical protein
MTGKPFENLESSRLALQLKLDEGKTKPERNRLGQFATPTDLADELLRYVDQLLPSNEKIRFLDPAFGTGAFYSALLRVFRKKRIAKAVGFEIDGYYGNPAARFWADHGLTLNLSDFTQERAQPNFNVVICNPPYVRHHHLNGSEKARLQRRNFDASGMRLSGLAGLYCYFLGLSQEWMVDGAIAGWLIPSEFMDVNYGQEMKRYLLDRVTLLHIHRFDPNEVQFADALVSSAVVWIRNSRPPKSHEVKFTFGGTLISPRVTRKVSSEALANESKWTRFPISDVRERSTAPTISDFFRIKRGLATGDNTYFILPLQEIEARRLPMAVFRPILPSPRYVSDDVVQPDEKGNPKTERRLFLLDTTLPVDEIKNLYPTLWQYLEEGRSRGLHERYLCRHRSQWYVQEIRPAAPIVCTYMGRGDAKSGRPFRFILNESKATAANVYLMMYPTPLLAAAMESDSRLIRRVWTLLNEIAPEQLLGEGRIYGGGLHKLEPKELGNVQIPQLLDVFQKGQRPMKQVDLFSRRAA